MERAMILNSKLENKFRRFGYCNPVQYSEVYHFINELKNFVNIVTIFDELRSK